MPTLIMPYYVPKPVLEGQLADNSDLGVGDHLFWLLTELSRHQKETWQVCSLPNIVQEVEILISNDEKEKKRLTLHMARMISDLAVVAQIQRQMGLSTCNEYYLSSWSDDQFDVWLRKRIAPYYKIEEVLFKGTGLALPVKDLRVFDYPSDKPRTATTTAKMRSAEQALDKFWDSLDQHFKFKTGKTLKEWEGDRIHYHDIQRTPEWKDVRPLVKDERDEEKATQGLDVSLALTTLEERTESTIDQTKLAAPRQKMKTRGPSPCPTHSAGEDPTAETVENNPPPQTPRITVKKKPFNTFAALFGRPVADKPPGELPWTDFKKAMVNVGFSSEKLQGSAWLFSSGLQSIVFHEPHPESKLPMQWARRIARRLNRNFGWTAESFVPEKGCG